MKPWYLSKTVWLNIFAAALLGVEVNLNLVQPHVPVDFYQLMATALPVINLLLRSVTNTGLTLAKSE